MQYIYSCYNLDWWLHQYVVTFFVSCNSPWFKLFFVWHKYYYPDFLLISIYIKHLFPFPNFQFGVFLDPKWVSFSQHIYGSCFCIHSATLCLLIGAFSPFAFTVITDMYVLFFIQSHKNYNHPHQFTQSHVINFFFHLDLLLALLWVHQFSIRVLKMLMHSVQQYSQLPETCTCQSLFHAFLEDETLL